MSSEENTQTTQNEAEPSLSEQVPQVDNASQVENEDNSSWPEKLKSLGLTDTDFSTIETLLETEEDELNEDKLVSELEMSKDDARKLIIVIRLLRTINLPQELNKLKRKKTVTRTITPAFQMPGYPGMPPMNPMNPYPMGYTPMPVVKQQTSQTGKGGASFTDDDSYALTSDTTLYVRNMPVTVTESDLVGLFQMYGPIKEIRMQGDKETGQFFGSIFVEYIHPSAAKLAKVQLDRHMWGGRTIYVDFAKERVKKTNPGNPSSSLYIGGLGPDVNKPLVESLFSRFGEITDIRILTDPMSGMPKGIAFVDYVLQESASAAIDQMSGTTFNGRQIRVSYASNPSKVKRPDSPNGTDGTRPAKIQRTDVPVDQSQVYGQYGTDQAAAYGYGQQPMYGGPPVTAATPYGYGYQ
jgi:RNA recognition motif-containing protein